MAPTAVESEAADHPPPPRAAGAGGDGVGGGGGSNGASEAVIDVSSSETESDSGRGKRPRWAAGRGGRAEKRARVSVAAAAVPSGFLDPLPSTRLPPPAARSVTKQFWKAGDYDGKRQLLGSDPAQHSDSGMEHVRVHPRFLHSNATSHKWALGAFAELLDNSLDEVGNGATYVNIDMLENKKDGTRMLLVEDDGGGMDPDKMRHCMSLGYSAKSKVKNTIGQYGNGFKTSTMRLGADVLVFSRSRGNEERRLTQSIGMLSYTFLRSTSKDEIIVPMIDYEKGQVWKRMVRTTLVDWYTSLETIIQWSPYSTEAELLQVFSSIKEQGIRIVIYNLWEDEQGELELDFDADVNDIQIRGANRDQKNIQMAKQFPNSKHFFTYRHSLRSYASILYLRVPYTFRMILRGKEIEHHNIIDDMMLKNQVTYMPVTSKECPKDTDMVANVIVGFVKDAKHHINIQGFNVYHKNRLIKPFWRVWTLPGCQGRGIIGVLEVNFVEPAHDKQDFELTNSLSRLEARLIVVQKKYWSDNCHRIGYGGNHANKNSGTGDRGTPSRSTSHILKTPERTFHNKNTSLPSPPSSGVTRSERMPTRSKSKEGNVTSNRDEQTIDDTETVIKHFKGENSSLKESILKVEESLSMELQIVRDKNKSLIERMENVQRQLETANKEQEALVDIFSEERIRRDQDEENLRKKLKVNRNSVSIVAFITNAPLCSWLRMATQHDFPPEYATLASPLLQEASSTIQDLLEQLNAARNCSKS